MSTQRTFQAMLNDFLPNELLKEEMVKRDYLLNKVEKDDTWIGASGSTGNGGNLIVPFKGAGASSVASGGLTASSDIAEDIYVRGQISTQPEIWGSMIFNHRDLMEHDKVSEKNFLKILPDSVDDFMDYLKNVVSVNLLNGPQFAKTTLATTSSNGVLTVDRVDRFVVGQKVIVQTTTVGNYVTGYVSNGGDGIDINAFTVLLVTARNGSTPVDFSQGNTGVAIGALLYNDGYQTSAMSSLRLALLSAANGGSTQLYGQTKTAYPYLQAVNVSGANITAANIVEQCFNGFTKTRLYGKGMPTDIVMSLTNLGYVMQVVEASKGAYNVKVGSSKASQYGWTEIEIGSVTNQTLKFVGVQEMDNDIIMFIDWRGLKFYSNGFFRKRKSPDGIEYFEVRATTGYQYIIDICLFGDLVVHRPSYMGIIFGVIIPAQ
jgi:hypothetical protein